MKTVLNPKKGLVTFLSLLMTLFIINNSKAQGCYPSSPPCSGGSALPSYSVTSGTPTWSGGTYKVGASNLAVSGSSTTLTISNSCIEFDNAAYGIGVTSGAHLILSNCTIYSSAGALWQGIKVNTGSWVTISNGTIIADAVKGVWSNSGANEAKFTITGSTFCHCNYGIYMSPFSSASMASTVTGTIFNGGSLLGSGNSTAGIFMSGIGTSTYVFTVGSAAAYGTSTNEFTGSDQGIHAEDSYINVQDCNFHDLHNTGTTGYGIFSKNTTGSADLLFVGLYTIYGANNLFDNCRIAINVDDDVETHIRENDFTSTHGSTYTMEKAIKIENSNSIIVVENNEIDDYEEQGVWLKDVSANYATIYGNTFNLTYISSTGSMAIRVYGSTLIDDLYLEIYGNIINAGRTGIYINSIWPPTGTYPVHDNEIYFGASTGNSHGIIIIDCYQIPVVSNYCEGNGSEDDDVRGIYFEDTPQFNCHNNHVNLCGVGIYCAGGVSESLINCNEIEDCPSSGMFFDNIGSGSSILYPNMTATGDPAGNFWLPDDPGTNRGHITGTTSFSSFTWKFSDNSGTETAYWMPNPCFSAGGGALHPTNIGGANDCGEIPYERLTEEGEFEALIGEITNMFGEYANQFNINDPGETLNDFYTLSSFWEKVTTNELDPNELPEELKDLYEYISGTNIPDIFDLSHALSSHDYEGAQTLLENINPANDIEYYITRISDLYLDNMNVDGRFEMNEEILPEIRSIAVLDGRDYGRGVYMARALMDTLIEYNMPEEFEKLGNFSTQQVVVYPNPAHDIITLEYHNGKPVTGIEYVEISSLVGDIVKEFSLTDNTIDISSISNGVYLLKVTTLQEQNYCLKLEIMK